MGLMAKPEIRFTPNSPEEEFLAQALHRREVERMCVKPTRKRTRTTVVYTPPLQPSEDDDFNRDFISVLQVHLTKGTS